VIWVDADACPVKSEVIHVAKRFQAKLTFVSHQTIKAYVGRTELDFVLCEAGPDAADDYIVECSQNGDLVLTMDLLLSRRLLEKKVRVMNFLGVWVDENAVSDGLGRKEFKLFSEALEGDYKKKKNKHSPFMGLFHNACSRMFEARG
jgi:uncharacterized protein